ncbi:restriction endonuclease [Micromonospora sp. NPDC049559]|uniref:restriction endonuclease n=1 Tax=Micromonospora sp. NPDC049559 TaxID=3155923 RepID=UPI0034374A71
MPRVRSYLRRDGTRVRAHRRAHARGRTPSRRPPTRRAGVRRRARLRTRRLPSGRLVLALLGLSATLWLTSAVLSFVGDHPRWSALIVLLLAAAGLGGWCALARVRGRHAARQAERERHIEVTDAMSGPQFERWVAALLTASGFTAVRVCGRSADRGADILAVAPDGRRTVVQCKRHAERNPVGSAAIQRFAGTCRAVHRGELCLIVTNGRFTAGDGVALARELEIVLVDRAALRLWAHSHRPPPGIAAAWHRQAA